MYKITDKYYLYIDEREYAIKEYQGEVFDKKLKQNVGKYEAVRHYGEIKALNGFLANLRRILLSEKQEKSKIKLVDELILTIKQSDMRSRQFLKSVDDKLVEFEINRVKLEMKDMSKEYEATIEKLKEEIKQLKNKDKENNK